MSMNAMNPDPEAGSLGRTPFATLRRFVRPRVVRERCELCSRALGPQHPHLFDPAARQVLCACEPCAVLFSHHEATKYRRVPRRIQFWPDFRMTDAQWDELHIPISLAFFFHSTPAGRVVALYPSPAGATESLLPLEAWQGLLRENPMLGELEPDVESLLVNRMGQVREHYRVPIDECFKLVGILRTHWRGLSGGAEVWREIGRFFATLKAQSGVPGAGPHA